MLDMKPSDRQAKVVSKDDSASMAPQRMESREAIQSAPAAANWPEPMAEEIAALAYQLWLERGSPHGSHEQDWNRAEMQLRSRQTLAKAAKV